MVHKFEHHVFQVVAFQLPMGNANTGFRYQLADHTAQLGQVGYAVEA